MDDIDVIEDASRVTTTSLVSRSVHVIEDEG